MSDSVIIVAGGSGNRFGSALPKQFLDLGGKPVIMHTIGVFYAFDPQLELILVLPENQFDFWKSLCDQHGFTIPHTVVAGGPERFFSVKNGISAVTTDGIVAIHDAVRPLVSAETLERCFSAARELGNAVPVVTPVDSIREIHDRSSRQVDRSGYRLVQTPQCFRKAIITAAFQQEFNVLFTDDASVAEAGGTHIHLVEGNRENLKITTPFDLTIAQTLLNAG
ncbi:MAG: 2-C-methyl-D-erythritol 4-phosphate cytidylyltransferase [Bacteroidota bacterium]